MKGDSEKLMCLSCLIGLASQTLEWKAAVRYIICGKR
jgi:hypothetical protein